MKSFLCVLSVAAALVLSPPSGVRADPASHDDTARFLAGLPPKEGTPLAPLTKERSWQNHANALNKAWARVEKTNLKAIGSWSKKYVSNAPKFVLYGFSGPDFLYANAFYPQATTYVLSALEPVGPIPNVTKMSRGQRSGALQGLRGSMQAILNYSFFITKKMKAQLRGQLKGTLPVLYVFLARSGKTIEDVSLISLNTDGSVSPRDDKTPKGADAGVKITFSDESEEKKTLYYFSSNIGNAGLKKSGFLAFCKELGPAASLIKSASYLPHKGHFSAIRKLIMTQSEVLIQDDSGIPIRYLQKAGDWDLKPFGRYAGPISIFANYYQREARRLWSRPVEKDIKFGVGYKWRRGETNLLLATKKERLNN